jgi:hypothetical protein
LTGYGAYACLKLVPLIEPERDILPIGGLIVEEEGFEGFETGG